MAQSLFAFNQEIEIINADEVWTAEIDDIPSGALDSSGSNFNLLDEVVICHADEVWNYGFNELDSGLTDSSNIGFELPNEAIVCHADEVFSTRLDNIEIDSGPNIEIRTPILFVPGLLGTKIKDSENNYIWIDLDRIINPLRPDSYSDSFLDLLVFGYNLKPTNDLFLEYVIKQETYLGTVFNYTKGLIDEFASKGYVENKDFFTFPYDWRYGVSGVYPIPENSSQRPLTNSDLLAARINELALNSPTGKIDIIAHSMGGLVVKKYVMDNTDPKINKLVFVGVPNLGSPQSAKTLLIGDDFKVPGLNQDETKKISRNMPAAYDLLPSAPYFAKRGGYLAQIEAFIQPAIYFKTLDYNQTNAYLNQRLNSTALANARNLRSADNFDNYDIRSKISKTYNIVGCK
ncbi:MAG: alpha/beta fold hydrolase, partial [Minisyncoccales bacterium]